MEDVWTHHRPLRWRCRGMHIGLRQFVSRDSIIVIDVARIFTRHRVLSGHQPDQAISYGIERGTRQSHTLRCTESARLAHLPRGSHALDRTSPKPLN